MKHTALAQRLCNTFELFQHIIRSSATQMKHHISYAFHYTAFFR